MIGEIDIEVGILCTSLVWSEYCQIEDFKIISMGDNKWAVVVSGN